MSRAICVTISVCLAVFAWLCVLGLVSVWLFGLSVSGCRVGPVFSVPAPAHCQLSLVCLPAMIHTWSSSAIKHLVISSSPASISTLPWSSPSARLSLSTHGLWSRESSLRLRTLELPITLLFCLLWNSAWPSVSLCSASAKPASSSPTPDPFPSHQPLQPGSSPPLPQHQIHYLINCYSFTTPWLCLHFGFACRVWHLITTI